MTDIKDPLDSDEFAAKPRPKPAIVDPLDQEATDLPTFESKETQFRQRMEGMSRPELELARAKNDAFGEFLRNEAKRIRPGETEEERFRRLYGSSGYKRDNEISTAEGVGRAYVQGGAFGFGDELVAGGAAALESAFRDMPFGKAYEGHLARQREDLDQFREESPVTAYGSEVVGALANPLSMAGSGVRTGALGTDMLLQGGLAGLQGNVYGFGQGEGGMENRAAQGLLTGAFAAPFGVAAPVASAGAKKTLGALAKRRAARKAGVAASTFDDIAERALPDDISRQQAIKNVERGGPEAMLVDADPVLAAQLDEIVASSGPAGTQARRAVEARAEDAARKFSQTLDSSLGRPEGLRRAAKSIAQKSSGARRSAYDEAYSVPIDYASEQGRNIEDVLSRVPNRVMTNAVREANEEMLSKGGKNLQILMDVADDGTVTFKEMPNVQQLDEIKQALGTMAKENVDQFGRPTKAGLRAQRLATELRDAIKDAVPEYDRALKLGGDKLSEDSALAVGSKFMRLDREAVRDAAKAMSDADRAQAALGIRQAIDDALARTKTALSDPNVEVREAIKGFKDLSSRQARENVTELIGKEKAEALFKRLDELSKAIELRANVARNSATFTRTETKQARADRVTGGPANRLRRAEPVETTREIARALMGRTDEDIGRLMDEDARALAEALTGPRGPDAVKTLRNIVDRVPDVERQQQLGQLLGRALLRGGSAPAGAQVREMVAPQRRAISSVGR